MKKIIMNKTLIAAAIAFVFAPAAIADERADVTHYPFTVTFGGGAMKMDAPGETYAPEWLSEYGPDFPRPVTFSRDPDWGHVRAVTLTWAPTASWRMSGAYRYGKLGGSFRSSGYEFVPGGTWQDLFDPSQVTYTESDPNRWIGNLELREEFEAVDFKVGRDIGIGSNLKGISFLSLGVSYAQWESASSIDMDGVPNRYSPLFYDPFGFNPAVPDRSYTLYTNAFSTRRTFEGYGPTLSWESGVRLLGDPKHGQVRMDWTLAGGVLFGEQTTVGEEARMGRYYSGPAPHHSPTAVLYDDTASISRKEDATVPHLSVEVGLSYTIRLMQISLLYSWERYYNAIDAGLGERKTYDRTMQGPTAQISIGFGG